MGNPMKVILFGATGMVGQGVLRECLLDADVETVLAVGRSPTGVQSAKLREIVHDNFLDFSSSLSSRDLMRAFSVSASLRSA
jgi:saccharopine dehydrogenase-like NADP-dependent oxidoreductase